VPARAATPFDAPRIRTLLERSLRTEDSVLASALPVPFAGGAATTASTTKDQPAPATPQ